MKLALTIILITMTCFSAVRADFYQLIVYPTLGGASSFGMGINDAASIVGQSELADNTPQAFFGDSQGQIQKIPMV